MEALPQLTFCLARSLLVLLLPQTSEFLHPCHHRASISVHSSECLLEEERLVLRCVGSLLDLGPEREAPMALEDVVIVMELADERCSAAAFATHQRLVESENSLRSRRR
jgi:hypothetical protein